MSPKGTYRQELPPAQDRVGKSSGPVAEKQIRRSIRTTALNSFNCAYLLYGFAAKEFKDKNINYYNNAITTANQVKDKIELLKAEHLKVLDNPLELSLERVIHSTNTKLEHQVASWATTMAIQSFQEVKNERGLYLDVRWHAENLKYHRFPAEI